MIQLDENDVARGQFPRPTTPTTASYPPTAYPAASSAQLQQGQRQPQAQLQPRIPPRGHMAPGTAAQQPPVARRSKADALRLADRLKRGVAAGAFLAFGALSLAVGSHIAASTTNANAATATSSQPPSSSSSSSSPQSSQSASSSSQSSGGSFFSSGSSSASSSTGVS